MKEIQEQQCASIGMKISILCASLGAVVPVGIMLKEFLQVLPGGFPAPSPSDGAQVKWPILIGIVITLLALYLTAILLGKVAGKAICQRRGSLTRASLIGVCLAISCMVVGVVVMALCMVADIAPIDFAESIEFFGAFSAVALLYGALPAILLGVLYGILVRWRLAKVEC